MDSASDAELDAKAQAEIDAGLGVPHERVREWLLRLFRGREGPTAVGVTESAIKAPRLRREPASTIG